MMDNRDFEVIQGSVISSASSDYEVQELLGSGTYGAVTKCRKVATNETVALKILKNTDGIEFAKEEAETLRWMKELNSENFNIVVLNNSFTFEGRFHLEFEKLDISLCEYMEMRGDSDPLELQEIRPIVQQLATALEFIKDAGVVHADLKPDNIMMVDHVRQPLRVKVIDFGIACRNPEERTGAILQTLWYRSPELLLGAPFDTAIDTWSLGCIAAEMMMGRPLFPGSDEYDMIRHIMYTIGDPPAHMLNNGEYTTLYYCSRYRRPWRFMTAAEMGKFDCVPCTVPSLDVFLEAPYDVPEEDAGADQCDRENFVDLLKKMLTVDSSGRITPSQILQHPFLTMSHLVGTFDNSTHVKSSVELMKNCDVLSSDDSEETTSSSPAIHPDEGHAPVLSEEEQLGLQACGGASWPRGSPAAGICGSPAKKRRRVSSEDSECGVRSPIATKKRRSESSDAADTGRQPYPMLRKRKRAATPHGISIATKKRRSESSDAADTGRQPCPMLRKRKRAATPHGISIATKKRRSDSSDAADTGRQPCPMLRKRKRAATPHGISIATKKRRSDSSDAADTDRQPCPMLRKRKRAATPHGISVATKKRRSESSDAADTDRQPCPMLRKRKRAATPHGISIATKKRRSESSDAADTDRQPCPMLRKRKRAATPHGISIATKKRRSESSDAADTDRQPCPMLRKRKRAATPYGISQRAKKRCLNLNEELVDNVKELRSDTEEATSSSTQVQSLKKRKRDDEEVSTSEEEETSPPVKRRRRSKRYGVRKRRRRRRRRRGSLCEGDTRPTKSSSSSQTQL